MKIAIILVRIGDIKMKTEFDLSHCYVNCPSCQSDSIHGHGLVITDDNTCSQVVSCDKCNYMWVEVYSFQHNIELISEEK